MVALDAEQVGQRQRHLAAGIVGEARGGPVGLLRLGPVEQVALEEGHLGAADQVGVDVGRAEAGRRPEVGVHRAVGVGRHDDQAAPGGGPSVAGCCGTTTPCERRSWAKTAPSWSSKTRPM